MVSGRAKILVISPKYFPVEEGLGHYTTEFCRHLADVFEVAVWTSRERGTVGTASGHAAPGNVTLIDTVRRWTWGGPFADVERALRFEPDRIVIQFVSFMYSRRGGINATIVWLALFLAVRARLTGRGRVQVMFHELWYPFSWRPKDAILHLAHRAMVLGLSLASSDVFCATERFAKEVKSMLGPLRGRVHVLVVGSNLETNGAPPPLPAAPDGALRIGLFGSLHVSKNVPLVLRSIHEATLKTTRPIRLTVVGASREELAGAAPELTEWLARDVRVLGPLEAREAAERLAEQDFIVSYFQDGVSSRRGSLLAALCEGVPVVTTWRDVSDGVFLSRPFVELFSYDEATFQRELVAFLTSSKRPFSAVSRDEVRAFYRENFSWRAIVNRYARLSRLADSSKRATPE